MEIHRLKLLLLEIAMLVMMPLLHLCVELWRNQQLLKGPTQQDQEA